MQYISLVPYDMTVVALSHKIALFFWPVKCPLVSEGSLCFLQESRHFGQGYKTKSIGDSDSSGAMRIVCFVCWAYVTVY